MNTPFPFDEALTRLHETAKSFAREQMAPRAATIDDSNAFPRDLWPNLGSLGSLIEEDFGGIGTSGIRRWLIERELFEETR